MYDKNKWHFLCKLIYIYDNIPLNSYETEKCFRKKICRENYKTYFTFSNFFFYENHVVYEEMKKNMVEPDRPRITI
jgi:hypothetical protein